MIQLKHAIHRTVSLVLTPRWIQAERGAEHAAEHSAVFFVAVAHGRATKISQEGPAVAQGCTATGIAWGSGPATMLPFPLGVSQKEGIVNAHHINNFGVQKLSAAKTMNMKLCS